MDSTEMAALDTALRQESQTEHSTRHWSKDVQGIVDDLAAEITMLGGELLALDRAFDALDEGCICAPDFHERVNGLRIDYRERWLQLCNARDAFAFNLPAPTFTAEQAQAQTDRPARKPSAKAKTKPKVAAKPKATRPTLRADISVEWIREIRALAADGYTHAQIAEIYDLKKSTVSNIIRGESWFGSVE